jgi:large subunit ribosomal protein L20
MPRVKRGKGHLKRRKALHRQTKGFEAGRKNLVKIAKTAVLKAGAHAYRDRRVKKRDFRSLWQTRINAAVRPHGLSYSKFMGKLKEKGIILDRKVLSEIAVKYPEIFTGIVNAVK